MRKQKSGQHVAKGKGQLVVKNKAQAVAIIDQLNRELKTAKTAKAKLAVRDKAQHYGKLFSSQKPHFPGGPWPGRKAPKKRS